MPTEPWYDLNWKLNRVFDALLVFYFYDQDLFTNTWKAMASCKILFLRGVLDVRGWAYVALCQVEVDCRWSGLMHRRQLSWWSWRCLRWKKPRWRSIRCLLEGLNVGSKCRCSCSLMLAVLLAIPVVPVVPVVAVQLLLLTTAFGVVM